MENLQHNKSKRKISTLADEKIWNTSKWDSIGVDLEGVISSSTTKAINNIDYDGDSESNDGEEQHQVEKKKSKVVRKSSKQVDCHYQDVSVDNTASTSNCSNKSSSNLVEIADLYESYTSIYQSCRYYYHDSDTPTVTELYSASSECSNRYIEAVPQNSSSVNINCDNNDQNRKQAKVISSHCPEETGNNVFKFLNSKAPIIAGQTVTLEESIGFSSDARLVVEAKFPFRTVHANAGLRKLFSLCTKEVVGLPLSHVIPTVLPFTSEAAFSLPPGRPHHDSTTNTLDLESLLLNQFQKKNNTSNFHKQRIRTVFHMVAANSSKKSIQVISTFNKSNDGASVVEASKLGLCSHYMIQYENCDSCGFGHTASAIA